MITLVAASDATAFAASVTVEVPDSVQDGDRLLLFAAAHDEPTITELPSGWAVLTEDVIGSGVVTWVFTRTADAEPDDYTVTWSGAHWHVLNLVAFRGVEHIRSHAVDHDHPASTIDLPPLEAEVGDALVAYGFLDEITTKSWQSPLAQITNVDLGIISAWTPVTASGPTPTYTLTGGTSGHIAATAILLTPTQVPDPAVAWPVQLRAELRLGSTWVDITDDVRAGRAGDVSIRRGRADEASQADAARCALILDNRSGRYSPRNPTSPHFGLLARNTPIRVGLAAADGSTYWRFAGEVSEWPVRWTVGEHDVTAPIEAAGPLRRLAQGSPPERSALRRLLRTAPGVITYWPLTDGEEATIASPDVGPHDMHIHQILTEGPHELRRIRLDWRSGELAAWLERVARSRGARGQITGRLPSTGRSWSVDLVRAGRGGIDRILLHTRPDAAGISQQWRLRWHAPDGELQLHVRSLQDDEPLGSFTALGVWDQPEVFQTVLRHSRLTLIDDGASGQWSVAIDGELLGSGATIRPDSLLSVDYRWQHDEADSSDHVALGHLVVWDEAAEPSPPTALDVTRAMHGHSGERAGVRIARILAEEGIAFAAVGDLEQTVACGPQSTASPLEVIRAAELVDGGILFESRVEPTLEYRTNRSRYGGNGGSGA